MMNKEIADEVIRRQEIYQGSPDEVYELGITIQNEELGKVFIPRAQLCLLGEEAKTGVLGRIINYVPYMFDEEDCYFVGSCSLAVEKNLAILPGCRFEDVRVGDQLTGVVEAIGMFEVQVNLGGAVGIIRKSDLLFEELTAAGDIINVRVVHKDAEKQSLTLTQFLFRPPVKQEKPQDDEGIVWNPEAVSELPRFAKSPLSPADELADPMAELNALIGLESIKQDVRSLVNLVRMQRIREQKGLKSIPVSLHLVFTGNPGTGKTSVARILAQLYRQIGVLKYGQLVEVDRSGLVAGYLGQTALKTQEKINEAMGGILFIDEAYTLSSEHDQYGKEAIDTLMKRMEDDRGKFVVIAAGYQKEMEDFMNVNPGLASRFTHKMHIEDYNEDELLAIFKKMASKDNYTLSPAAEFKLMDLICRKVVSKSNSFGNAREMRNMLDETIQQLSVRVSAMPQSEVTQETYQMILPEDIKDEL